MAGPPVFISVRCCGSGSGRTGLITVCFYLMLKWMTALCVYIYGVGVSTAEFIILCNILYIILF